MASDPPVLSHCTICHFEYMFPEPENGKCRQCRQNVLPGALMSRFNDFTLHVHPRPREDLSIPTHEHVRDFGIAQGLSDKWNENSLQAGYMTGSAYACPRVQKYLNERTEINIAWCGLKLTTEQYQGYLYATEMAEMPGFPMIKDHIAPPHLMMMSIYYSMKVGLSLIHI